MPTVRQNATYFYSRFMGVHKGTVSHLLKSVMGLVVLAFLLEAFLFNINYYLTSNYNSISLNDKLNLQETADKEYKLTAVNHTLEFSHLNIAVRNVWINFDDRQAAQELKVKVQFTDASHKTYFDSTEYTVGVPDASVSTFSPRSKYLNLQTTGLVDNLKIEITGKDVHYPIRLSDICVNARYPYDFNTNRFLFTAGILLLCFAFRPHSAIYRIGIVNNPRKSKAAIIAAVVLEVYLLSSFLLMGSNLVGVATEHYNSGSWDGHSIANTFQVGGDNAQQYADLAEAMAHGQLYLQKDPPQWLKDMSDPYDKGARDEVQKQTGEPYLFDVAYHQGHYYVYFGVVPVVLFYLPFYLITGSGFPTAVGVLLACIAFVLGCSALLDRFARYHFKHVSLGLYLLLQIPLVACCGVGYLLKFPTFYSLPIMLGLAFSVWGLYLWMRGRVAKRSEGWYLAGSFCMALVVGCRPQLAVLSLLAFPLFWRVYISERRLFTRSGMREFLCLIAPYVVVAIALMLYNRARFGSFTDFGATYNLTVNDMTKRGWNIGRLAPALFSYFVQPASVTGVFPYVQAAPFETTYMGQTIKEVTFGGIFACLPILWILPFSGRILSMRIHQRSTRTIMGVIVVLLASGLVVALMDAEVAGILQRYYADFSFMFLAAVVLLVFIINENLDQHTSSGQLLARVLLVLVALSLIYSLLLCFVPETGWYSDVYPWAYQDILETVQFWS